MEKLKLQEELWMKEHISADDVVEDIVANEATTNGPLFLNKAI